MVHGVVVDVDVVAGPGHLQYSTVQYSTVQYGTVLYGTVLTTPRPTNFLDLTSLSAWAWARVRAALGPAISSPEISTRVTCSNHEVSQSPEKAFSLLKVPTRAFTIKNVLRQHIQWVLHTVSRH